LSQWRSIEAAGNKRKWLVHAGTARRIPPSYQLFGCVKRCFAGLSFEDADQLLAAVEGVPESIEKMTLQTFFLEWMDRLRKCIGINGEYTEETQINVIEEGSFILAILRCSCSGGTPCKMKQGRGKYLLDQMVPSRASHPFNTFGPTSKDALQFRI
jgi:hypothetical protein